MDLNILSNSFKIKDTRNPETLSNYFKSKTPSVSMIPSTFLKNEEVKDPKLFQILSRTKIIEPQNSFRNLIQTHQGPKISFKLCKLKTPWIRIYFQILSKIKLQRFSSLFQILSKSKTLEILGFFQIVSKRKYKERQIFFK